MKILNVCKISFSLNINPGLYVINSLISLLGD